MSDRDEIERLNAEVERLREDVAARERLIQDHADLRREAESTRVVLRAKLAAAEKERGEWREVAYRHNAAADKYCLRANAAEGLLESIRDQANHDGCEECWLACADIDAHFAGEPDLGEPSPPLTCPSCGWEFGAMEPEPTEPEPDCECSECGAKWNAAVEGSHLCPNGPDCGEEE